MNAAKRVAVSATAFLAAAALAGPAHAQEASPFWMEWLEPACCLPAGANDGVVFYFSYNGPIQNLSQLFDLTSPSGMWRLTLSVEQEQADRGDFIYYDSVSFSGELQHLGLPGSNPGSSPFGTILSFNAVIHAAGSASIGYRVDESDMALGPHEWGPDFDILGYTVHGFLDPFLLDAFDPRQPPSNLDQPTTRQPYLSGYQTRIIATHYVPETVPAWGAVTVLLLGIGTAARHGRR